MKNASACIAHLSALPGKARAAVSSAQRQAVQTAHQHARSIVPVRTGALKASLTLRTEDQSARFMARRYYAVYVEYKKPYLRPAAQAADYPNRLGRLMKEVLK